MSFDFTEASVLITGAAGGIGQEIVRSFAVAGANVLLCGSRAERLESAMDALSPSAQGRLLCHQMDVTRAADWQAAVQRALDEFGRLDHVVNNAGLTQISTIVDTSEADWDRVLRVNLTGTFLGIRTALPVLKKQSSGTITNVASMVAKKPMSMLSAYCASKAGVISLTQVAALEAAPSVRVNCVSPGVLDTPMQELEYEIMAETTGKDRAEVRQEWIDTIPLQALQMPSDIASAVLFLASEAASQITGETLNVNGGWLMA